MASIRQDFLTWLQAVRGYTPALRVALGIFLILFGLFGARLFRRLFQKMRGLTTAHAPEWLTILTDGFLEPFVLLVRFGCWYLAVYALPLPTAWLADVYSAATAVFRLALIALAMLGLWNSSALCGLLLRSAQNKLDLQSSQTMLGFFEKFYRALILVLGLITVMNELGFNVTGLITGAGLVGLTLSLAAQSTVSNFVAGVALVLERPFGIGDYVTIGAVEGTVEDISFRTTRIRTIDNALISMENATVCAQSIQNIANRTSRLWSFTLGVTYRTSRAQLEALCAALAAALRADAEVLSDTVEVNLSDFSSSGISIAVQCYVKTTDIVPFRQLKTRLNLVIMAVMEEQGCAFAFPSTSVYFENDINTNT